MARPRMAVRALALLLAGTANADTPLTTVRVASGLTRPVEVVAARGDARLFVVEKDGLVKIVSEGAVLPIPFLDLRLQVGTSGEQGLLGIAFHPLYEHNGSFVTSYVRPDAANVLSRWSVLPGDPDRADPASEEVLLVLPRPVSNHYGGRVAFGPQGYLHAAFGDGDQSNDPLCNAQDLSTWLGKMLRIDVDGGTPYAVPPDNPFVGVPGALPEILHLGLRNPWRWSFDRASGELYIGDVGEITREEIDSAPAGALGRNFGWPVEEGSACNPASSCAVAPACGAPELSEPLHEFVYGVGGQSITGGYVYRGCAIPDLRRAYFFADFVSARIWSLRRAPGGGVTGVRERTAELAPGGGLSIDSIVSFGEDGFGELHVVDYGGEIFRIVPAAPPGGFVDCDGNGLQDLCEIANDPDLDLDGSGGLDRCQTLSADVGWVSVAGGGAQVLSLHAGPGQAGRTYWVLGSLNGTSPGFGVDGFTVPLSYDPYTRHTIRSPNKPPFSDSRRKLDQAGTGTATFSVASVSVPPALIGRKGQHAFVTLDRGSVVFVSNPVEVEFLP